MPVDLSSYFMLPPAYWQPNLPLFSFNSPGFPETQTEQSHFPNLVRTITSNDPEPNQGQQDLALPTIGNAIRQSQPKKVLSSDEDGEEEEFKIKLGKNLSGISVSYKKKNTESNIVNQTFSFLNSDRSKSVVEQYFKGEPEKVEEYYRLMAKVKQCSKKYINRKYLQRLLSFEAKTEFERAFTKAKLRLLTVNEIRHALRALMFNFLRDQSTQTLLTSSKIYK